ncbi:MAG: glycosyltransferase [candidate division NC10 bacterium]
MKLSIIVPAYNEEKLLGACLASVRETLALRLRPGLESEVVVCDNASTDSTPRIAQDAGAKLVFEPVRRISVARNSGAAAASGDWFLFIDADSRLSPAAFEAMLQAAESGRFAGGGCLIDFDRKPWWGAFLVKTWNLVSLTMRWAAGSFVFCRADAFKEAGGFPPELAAGEELGLARALKAWGKPRGLGFTILTGPRHVSSGRKCYLYSPWELIGILLEMAMPPWRGMRDTRINRQLYDGRR